MSLKAHQIHKQPLVHRPGGRPPGKRDLHGKAHRVPDGAELPVMRAFAEHLRFVREEAEVSVSELSAALGNNEDTVHSWEAGRSRPTLRMLIRVAMALRVPLDHLVPEV